MTKRDVMRVKNVVSAAGVGFMIMVLMTGFQNCSSQHSAGEGSSSGQQPSLTEQLEGFENSAKAVLAEDCASCHSAGSGVTSALEDVVSTQYLLDQAFVVPGEPQNSPIYLIPLDGIGPHDSGILDQEELGKIRDWIVSLADPTGTGGLIIPPVDGEGGENDNAPTFAFINSTIIQPRCVGCHRAGDARGGRRLDSYAAVFEIVDTDQANRSIFYQEILNDNMPPNGAPLTAAQKSFVLQWIQAGAQNN